MTEIPCAAVLLAARPGALAPAGRAAGPQGSCDRRAKAPSPRRWLSCRRSRRSRSRTACKVACIAIDTAPGRRGPGLVPRRQQGRAPRPPRLGPHVRAHDVQGHAARARRGPRAVPQRDRRLRQRARPTRTRPTTSTRCRRTTSTSRCSSKPSACGICLFRKEMIDGEREVVKEEIRQQENSPIAKGFLRFLDDRVHEAPVRVDRRRQHQGSRRDDARQISRSSTTRTTSRTTRCSSSSARRRSSR